MSEIDGKLTINNIYGIFMDLRQSDPRFAEILDQLAEDLGVEPLTGKYVVAVAAKAATGKIYDLNALGMASIGRGFRENAGSCHTTEA